MDAERCERSAELRFGHPVETVFEMFTPEGERAWADGWDPRPIHPPGETGARDAVFSTEHGGRHAVWLVTELDRASSSGKVPEPVSPFVDLEGHRSATGGRGPVFAAGYVNFVDGERVTRVDVACEAVGPSETRAVVRYVVTGLTEAGNAYVRRFDAHFDAEMHEWQRSIAAALDAGS